MHMILGLARTLHLHITAPLWGNPLVMRLFDTDTVLSLDWTSCWSISQSAGECRCCGAPVTSLLCHRETLNYKRNVGTWEIRGDRNTVNFMKCLSFSSPISFGQLWVKPVTKRCSSCRYPRFTDIEWASKIRFEQSSEAMGIPIQAWMTNDIVLFSAIWLLIDVQILMIVWSISFSNSGPNTNMTVHHRMS